MTERPPLFQAQREEEDRDLPSVWLERWNDTFVVPQRWQSMAVFNHPTYPCGQNALVGDVVQCPELDKKHGNAGASLYCVTSVHCERRGDRQHPYVMVGNVFAHARDDADDLIEASEPCNEQTMQKAKRAILKPLEYIGRITDAYIE